MVKILFINILIYLNINIIKQTNFEYDFWAKVCRLSGCMCEYGCVCVDCLVVCVRVDVCV